jgi:SOS response regulatory protein OraA/RecX
MSRRPSASRADERMIVSSDAAFEAAARALRHRDRTSAQIARHLAERGYGDGERSDAIERLVRAGVLDDVRYAENRAAALADRSAGDASIRHDLRSAGVTDTDVEHALERLEPERRRAERVLARRGVSPKTRRYLAAKGYSEETIAAVIARAGDDALG